MRYLFEESAPVVGKSTKPEADGRETDATLHTVTNPFVPGDREASIEAVGPAESQSGIVPGARSSERIILSAGSTGIGQCLVRHEVVAYLGTACPRDLRARVDAHIADCVPCGRWVRHVDGDLLEYIGGQGAEEELARMDAHLDACKVCRELMHHVLQGMAKSWHGDERDPTGDATTFVPGNVVNSRYLIRSFVGRGGMGEVYEAFDRLMDRRIALKTLLCTAADRPRAVRRFKEEVRNAQRVGHPHVCRINDLQEHDEGMFGPALPFFTMEYIEGDRLGNRLLEGPLPLDHVRIIALQLLDGLRAAHRRGVLHLDFKSDNVMLRRNIEAPDAVIMDFGLSRVLGSESKLRTSDRRQFAGTLPYMSVEQLECREQLGPATDVYAFGVVLYEMLTRSLPFEGETLGSVLLKQLNERPKPPSRHVPDLSPALDRFVLKCLKSDPRARYADAERALLALESVGAWSRPRGAKAHMWKLAVPAVLATALALPLVTSSRRPAPPPANLPITGTQPPVPGAVSAPKASSPAPPAPAGEPKTASSGPPASSGEPPASVASSGATLPHATAAAPASTDVAAAASRSDVRRLPTRAFPPPVERLVGPTRSEPPLRGPTRSELVQNESARSEPTRSEPARSEPTRPGAAGDGSTWKPSRVPKRLSGSSAPPARNVEAAAQKVRR